MDAVAGVIKADVGIKVCPSTSVTIYMTKYHNAPHKGLPQGGKVRGGEPNAIWHFQELESRFSHTWVSIVKYDCQNYTPRDQRCHFTQPGHVPDPEAVHKR